MIGKGLLLACGVAVIVGALAWSGAIRVHVSGEREDPRTLAKDWGHKGAVAQHWDPPLAAASGMQLLTFVDRDKRACIAYRGAGYQGGTCFQNGWAVEAEFTPAVTGTLIVGMTIPAATHVRFGRSRAALTIPVQDVPGRTTERYFAFVIPQGGLKVAPDDIVALDARGRLLGRQHFNDGHNRFGADDGLYDRNFNGG